jgi:hypothetical protein
MFEIGPVFVQEVEGELPVETTKLTIIMIGTARSALLARITKPEVSGFLMTSKGC